MKLPTLISASAGSGKTYTLTETIFQKVNDGIVRPDQIIATTFTIRAATELKNRIREKLLEEGKVEEANKMSEAQIGTINSVCFSLLKKYAFQAGLSPLLETLDEKEQKIIIREVLGEVIDDYFIELATKLYQSEHSGYFVKVAPYIKQIEDIISKVRANDLNLSDIEKYGESSVTELFDLYGGQLWDHHDLKKMSLELAKEMLGNMEIAPKPNKSKISNLQLLINRVETGGATWWDWLSLGKEPSSKALSAEKRELLTEATSNFLGNKKFREDYSRYITQCFIYAKEAIVMYQAEKKSKSLLDFTDQEAYFYKLLRDNKTIAAEINAAYKLVLVDEFQDVSPLQLAIFMEMTQVVDESIWVGDPKQSIYEFRGADPMLMKSVVNEIPDKDRQQLTESWRSRTELVDFVNAVYAESFREHLMQSEIVLSPADYQLSGRDSAIESSFPESVNYWKLKGSNFDKNYRSFSARLKSLLDDPPLIFDKIKKTYRKATYSDVSILCRSGARCRALSESLNALGLPTAVSGFHLTKEPEIILLLALLKLISFPDDTLAKAEVLLFTEFSGDQVAMIKDRMAADNVYSWQSEHPLLAQIKSIMDEGFNLSPSALIEKLIIDLELESIIAGWGSVKQRLSNCDALVKHAREYQGVANRLNIASSLPGFINWMEDLNDTEKDEKGLQYGNAIQIMTYHGSKGLEWPIVFLWDLQATEFDKIYGVRMMTDSKEVDLQNPLAERRIRHWVKPVGMRSGLSSFEKAFEGTAQREEATVSSHNEERRLLYVSFTRARDYLYFCGIAKKENLEMNKAAIVSEKLLMIDKKDGVVDSGFSWEGKTIHAKIESLPEIEDETAQPQSIVRNYFHSHDSTTAYKPQRLNPSSTHALSSATAGPEAQLHARHYVHRSEVNDAELGTFIHRMFCAYEPSNPAVYNEDWIRTALTQVGLDKLIDASWMYNSLIAFHAHLGKTYVEYTLHKELPIHAVNTEGQSVSGFVDLVVEIADCLLIFDYKTFVMSTYYESKYNEKALEFSGQLDLYAKVLEQSFGKKVDGRFIYFVFEGRVVELR